MGTGLKKKSFWGDVIIGASLGPVFSTCSPTYFIVLATVLPVSPVLGMLYLLAYTVGLCLALLFVSVVGQKIISYLGIAADPKGWFKKVLGVLFLLVGIAIIGGFDKKIQLFLIDAGIFDITKIEQGLLQKNNTEKTTSSLLDNSIGVSAVQENTPISNIKKEEKVSLDSDQKKDIYKKVPELSTIDGYINTDGKPITLESLRGKVVLLDIWTYSCINCQRTIPHINAWYEKYKDQGLEVVGLHTPEFAFEKVQANVQKAVQGFKIMYPVVMDNDYSTWNALGNQYWPRKYLIDIDGYIVYDHIGEGSYEETEKAIQKALQERAVRNGLTTDISSTMSNPGAVVTVDSSKVLSPEIYFGSFRNIYLKNGESGANGEQTLSVPSDIVPNALYLGGTWNVVSEYAENVSASEIVFKYQSKNVYMAAGSLYGVEVEVYKDDVFVKKIQIKDETLYTLIEGTDYGNHVLKIKIPKAGLKAFTFTFG
jgi:thiol-disulfide isomerase/thioredoxin